MDLERGGIQNFQIHGELYHLQGPLNPSSGQRPRFAQLYFYDPSYAAQACSTTNPNIKETLLRSIMEELREVNPWYRMYLTAYERLQLARASQAEEQIYAVINPQLKLVGCSRGLCSHGLISMTMS